MSGRKDMESGLGRLATTTTGIRYAFAWMLALDAGESAADSRI